MPNHVAANFPTSASACATCQTITSWSNGVFDHSSTGFPPGEFAPDGACREGQCVYAVPHRRRSQIYRFSQPIAATPGAIFLDPGSRPTIPPIRPLVRSLPSPIARRVTTPSRGRISPTFNHAATGFALTGTHMSPTPTPCAACHVNNNYTSELHGLFELSPVCLEQHADSRRKCSQSHRGKFPCSDRFRLLDVVTPSRCGPTAFSTTAAPGFR